MNSMQVEGSQIPNWFLRVETQPEVGVEGYDGGAKMLTDFFKKTLQDFLVADLSPLGRKIIDCCMQDGSVTDYEALLGSEVLVKDAN
jgi:hypothetical protein